MQETHEHADAYRLDKGRVTGRQAYHLDVPSAANAKDISVISYQAHEGMASPYEITIEFTHPEQLSRADYLGRDGHFTITAEDSTQPRVYRGVVTGFKRIKKTKDYFRYTIVVESQMARMRLLHASRVYQHQSTPQIIESMMLREFMDHQFVFKLRREYPVHDFRLQYQMSDFDYIKLLCEKAGIYFYIEQGKHGDVVVFGDDIDHYVYPFRRTAENAVRKMERRMRRIATVSLLIAVLTLAGCQTDYDDMTAAEHAAYSSRARRSYTFKPDPNAPIQVTYRIDDHRFMTLENYDRCYGDNYFNNTALGIHEKVWTGDPTGYRGRLIIDDPSGANVVLPTAENRSCGDRGCTSYFAYSTDAGRTFRWFDYLRYTSIPSEASEKYKIAVTTNALYIVKADAPNLEQSKGAYVRKGPLYSMVDLTHLDGTEGLWETGDKAPQFPVGLRSPSGQDRFTCDASIRSAGQPKTP